jgi:hypothetical protein
VHRGFSGGIRCSKLAIFVPMGLILQLVRGTIIGGEKKKRAHDCGKVDVNASGHASLCFLATSTVDTNLEGCCGSVWS